MRKGQRITVTANVSLTSVTTMVKKVLWHVIVDLRKNEEGNVATSQEEEVWDTEAIYAQVEDFDDDLALTTTTKNYRKLS